MPTKKTSKSPDAQKVEYIAIKVTAGILLHIGAGIYNSVAGAIKELVSNSFDADAEAVIISTNYPHFDEIKVSDNGIGMSSSRLRQAMQTIGSSLKGVATEGRISEMFSRPIVGHLGIGLMALSQVCSKAKIESQEIESDVKFVAELDFSEFKQREQEQIEVAKLEIFRDMNGGIDKMKEKLLDPSLDDDERAELDDAIKLAKDAEKLLNSKTDTLGEHLGHCMIYPALPAILGEHGTVITLSQIDKGVRDTLRDVGRTSDVLPKKYDDKDNAWDDYRDEINTWSWTELIQRLNRKTSNLSFESLPKYHQFLWELAAMTPINYVESGPVSVDKSILKAKKQQLEEFKFSLVVDNQTLLKPILLPSGSVAEFNSLEKELDYVIRKIDFDDIIDGEALEYHGYLYWQREQNHPSKVRGLRIFIRNVGIGLYDDSLMNFKNVNPTSRAGQISGEIYVDQGLERALSVDRNSFKDTDAHYKRLEQHVWRLLGSTKQGDGILGNSVDSYVQRKERSDGLKKIAHHNELKSRVEQMTNNLVKIDISEKENDSPYKTKANRITVYENSPAWPRSGEEKYLFQKIIVSLRAALLAGATAEELLDKLEELLLKSKK